MDALDELGPAKRFHNNPGPFHRLDFLADDILNVHTAEGGESRLVFKSRYDHNSESSSSSGSSSSSSDRIKEGLGAVPAVISHVCLPTRQKNFVHTVDVAAQLEADAQLPRWYSEGRAQWIVDGVVRWGLLPFRVLAPNCVAKVQRESERYTFPVACPSAGLVRGDTDKHGTRNGTANVLFSLCYGVGGITDLQGAVRVSDQVSAGAYRVSDWGNEGQEASWLGGCHLTSDNALSSTTIKYSSDSDVVGVSRTSILLPNLVIGYEAFLPISGLGTFLPAFTCGYRMSMLTQPPAHHEPENLDYTRASWRELALDPWLLRRRAHHRVLQVVKHPVVCCVAVGTQTTQTASLSTKLTDSISVVARAHVDTLNLGARETLELGGKWEGKSLWRGVAADSAVRVAIDTGQRTGAVLLEYNPQKGPWDWLKLQIRLSDLTIPGWT